MIAKTAFIAIDACERLQASLAIGNFNNFVRC